MAPKLRCGRDFSPTNALHAGSIQRTWSPAQSPLVAGHVEVDAQRPPDLARLDALFDRLGGGTAIEAGQDMVDQHRRAIGGTESQDHPIVELRQPHSSQFT